MDMERSGAQRGVSAEGLTLHIPNYWVMNSMDMHTMQLR